ncbi:MAG: hypothetical protein A2W61_07620 [Deltaproteobacteria bacterium RIFCSPLOWO2_01_44_7]|nr:MAG: hypothetical protein A2712_04350 [Deltaproteobacteria bacterium RIFCSPHIGHO2_01_FULL_43_49]OGQ16415.1 MAG: hypothetical protein A3D22_02315 [Deltaproteobacteria bacterium RIFCSPHIGHO2_02_FULL_44_53]OGQ27758.1 MAG: hypothetical protein A3D98_08670 [Deltaproteobacteria bacterium RIFCSPHIGHO2_12_FULL_44_21]OGQ32933.1 MAG: hypothetical protein A2979_10245 [Deltaproteobacteria bacterium RIFCSPLOWO2_01_FULL_45_74]OGQ38694.1 MAG: hypothetical protein A2W61_07620 [Deltaproteobacteria bacterium 
MILTDIFILQGLATHVGTLQAAVAEVAPDYGTVLQTNSVPFIKATYSEDPDAAQTALVQLHNVFEGLPPEARKAIQKKTRLSTQRFESADSFAAALRKAFGYPYVDLKRLEPKETVALSADIQIHLAKKLHREVERLCSQTYADICAVEIGQLEELQKIHDDLSKEFKRLRTLLRSFFSNDVQNHFYYLTLILASSSSQMAESFIGNLQASISNLSDLPTIQPMDWENAIHEIPDPNLRDYVPVSNGKGYSVRTSKKQLAYALVEWLRWFGPEESWENETWVLKFPKTLTITKAHESPLTHSSWPPDRTNDEILDIYLELLGWNMKVESGPETTIVKITFGKVL